MLPTNYREGIPRVSALVESVYPFNGEAQRHFYDWLHRNNISVEEYMQEASTGGTAVHLALENLCLGLPGTIQPRWAPYVASGRKFMQEMNVIPVRNEVYILTETYQGTIDAIVEIDGEKWIIDWKTFGLAKHRFGLPIPKWKKPYDKLKKATLQLSFYAHAKRIRNIAVVELTTEGYYFHKLERMSKKDLVKIITTYNKNKENGET